MFRALMPVAVVVAFLSALCDRTMDMKTDTTGKDSEHEYKMNGSLESARIVKTVR